MNNAGPGRTSFLILYGSQTGNAQASPFVHAHAGASAQLADRVSPCRMLQKGLQERVNGGIIDPGLWPWMRTLSATCPKSKLLFAFAQQPARQVGFANLLDHPRLIVG